MAYVDDLYRMCGSVRPPFCRNIAPRHFIVISTPIKISHFVLKNLVPPTSGIPKRVRTSKSVKNCENFIGVYILRAKKTPGIIIFTHTQVGIVTQC